jgi:hypothetical protein
MHSGESRESDPSANRFIFLFGVATCPNPS